MKLYWRVKINGKWNWRPVGKDLEELAVSLVPGIRMNLSDEEE